MTITTIGIILTIILIIWVFSFIELDIGEKIGLSIANICFLWLCIFAFWLVILITPIVPTESQEYNFYIYALKDNQTTIIARRSAQTSDRYYFIRKESAGYKRGWINCDNAYIQYDNIKHPQIKVNKIIYKKDSKIAKFLKVDGSTSLTGIKTYTIIVPEGTVREEFEIDLEN